MSEFHEKSTTDNPEPVESSPKSVSRRALLRGGMAAMPTILTLHSGAALARSSNLISASSPGTTDSLGRTVCLDTNTVEYASETESVFDLGEPPRPATVNIIAPREYYRKRSRRSKKYTAGGACEKGGTFYFKDVDGGGWRSIQLPQFPRSGVVVSSGAMTSMADHIIDTLI